MGVVSEIFACTGEGERRPVRYRRAFGDENRFLAGLFLHGIRRNRPAAYRYGYRPVWLAGPEDVSAALLSSGRKDGDGISPRKNACRYIVRQALWRRFRFSSRRAFSPASTSFQYSRAILNRTGESRSRATRLGIAIRAFSVSAISQSAPRSTNSAASRRESAISRECGTV